MGRRDAEQRRREANTIEGRQMQLKGDKQSSRPWEETIEQGWGETGKGKAKPD